jgi:RimJ/RimL family protein N-acetyltransferase
VLRPIRYPHSGAVTLRPLLEISSEDWRRFYLYFRDQEIANWNGTSPVRLPLWLFKNMVIGEERSNERTGFGIYLDTDEIGLGGRFIGSVELYDFVPAGSRRPAEATLGIIIGEKDCWSQGYGAAACRAVVGYGFEQMKLERVRLTTLSHNARARRAFEKVGFRLERIVESEGNRNWFRKSSPRLDAHYVLRARDWPVPPLDSK